MTHAVAAADDDLWSALRAAFSPLDEGALTALGLELGGGFAEGLLAAAVPAGDHDAFALICRDGACYAALVPAGDAPFPSEMGHVARIAGESAAMPRVFGRRPNAVLWFVA